MDFTHKLLGMRVENFMKCKLVSLDVGGKSIEIKGRNGSGKTSVLNALFLGLAGTKVMADLGITKPVRDGEEMASISIDLDDLLVRRELNPDGSPKRLLVCTREGYPLGQGQTILDAFRGKLFDISAFGRMDTKKQTDLILPIINLKLDLVQWAAERKNIFEERTIINREVKALEAQIEAVPVVESPDEEVSIADIAAEMQTAQEQINANTELRGLLQNKVLERSNITRQLEASKARVAGYKEQIEALELQIANERSISAGFDGEILTINREGKELQERIKALPEDPDMTGYQQRMADVEKINARVRQRKERARLQANLTAKEKTAQLFTIKLDELDQKKIDYMKEATWPIEGMGIDETGITYNGVPTSQASGGENLLMGYAVAKALSPNFNVLRLSRPDDLDDENKAKLYAMAEADGYIIVAEQVSHGDESGLVIEDGELDGGTTPGLEKISEVAKPKRVKKAKGDAIDPPELKGQENAEIGLDFAAPGTDRTDKRVTPEAKAVEI